MPPLTASSAALVRLFMGGPSGVVLERDVVRFTSRAAVPVGAIDRIETRPSWFWTRLTVRQAGGAVHAVGGLPREDAERLAAAVREEAGRAAGEVTAELLQLSERLAGYHGGDRYRRHSGGTELQADIATAVQRCSGALLRSHLPPGVAGALARIGPFANPGAFEQAREEANDRFVASSMPASTAATAGVLSNPPTDEQAAAIATDEDVTLVLAGAGTGKTAVITGKVAHLVRNEGVSPGEILVLAFNRKAADEIRERLPDDLASARVAPFHVVGLRGGHHLFGHTARHRPLQRLGRRVSRGPVGLFVVRPAHRAALTRRLQRVLLRAGSWRWHEKGGLEGEVGRCCRHLVPVPRAKSVDELNALLEAADRSRTPSSAPGAIAAPPLPVRRVRFGRLAGRERAYRRRAARGRRGGLVAGRFALVRDLLRRLSCRTAVQARRGQ